MSTSIVGIQPEELIGLMRHVPSPVTVVTAVAVDEMRGMTAGSFTSVSLDPPLITFNVMQDSQMHGVLMEAEHFAIHILSDAQAAWSDHFARPNLPGAEQFAHLPYHRNAEGVPILEGTLGVLHCRRFAMHTAGDHTIFIGEVLAADLPATEGQPLVYYRRGYHRVGETLSGKAG